MLQAMETGVGFQKAALEAQLVVVVGIVMPGIAVLCIAHGTGAWRRLRRRRSPRMSSITH